MFLEDFFIKKVKRKKKHSTKKKNRTIQIFKKKISKLDFIIYTKFERLKTCLENLYSIVNFFILIPKIKIEYILF